MTRGYRGDPWILGGLHGRGTEERAFKFRDNRLTIN